MNYGVGHNNTYNHNSSGRPNYRSGHASSTAGEEFTPTSQLSPDQSSFGFGGGGDGDHFQNFSFASPHLMAAYLSGGGGTGGGSSGAE